MMCRLVVPIYTIKSFYFPTDMMVLHIWIAVRLDNVVVGSVVLASVSCTWRTACAFDRIEATSRPMIGSIWCYVIASCYLVGSIRCHGCVKEEVQCQNENTP